MATKYTIRKYMGDDIYSWAVFRKDELKGVPRGPVVEPSIKPIVCGCSRNEAGYYKEHLEKKHFERTADGSNKD